MAPSLPYSADGGRRRSGAQAMVAAPLPCALASPENAHLFSVEGGSSEAVISGRLFFSGEGGGSWAAPKEISRLRHSCSLW